MQNITDNIIYANSLCLLGCTQFYKFSLAVLKLVVFCLAMYKCKMSKLK